MLCSICSCIIYTLPPALSDLPVLVSTAPIEPPLDVVGRATDGRTLNTGLSPALGALPPHSPTTGAVLCICSTLPLQVPASAAADVATCKALQLVRVETFGRWLLSGAAGRVKVGNVTEQIHKCKYTNIQIHKYANTIQNPNAQVVALRSSRPYRSRNCQQAVEQA